MQLSRIYNHLNVLHLLYVPPLVHRPLQSILFPLPFPPTHLTTTSPLLHRVLLLLHALLPHCSLSLPPLQRRKLWSNAIDVDTQAIGRTAVLD